MNTKVLFRIGVAILTAAGTAVVGLFQGGEGVSLLNQLFGDAGIAGVVAGLIAWVLGWALGKLPSLE